MIASDGVGKTAPHGQYHLQHLTPYSILRTNPSACRQFRLKLPTILFSCNNALTIGPAEDAEPLSLTRMECRQGREMQEQGPTIPVSEVGRGTRAGQLD